MRNVQILIKKYHLLMVKYWYTWKILKALDLYLMWHIIFSSVFLMY